jgi:hypothetical protein
MPAYDWLPLAHLDRMTDSTGLIQHAIYSIPRRESGYTTDDNARALRLCARLWKHDPDEQMLTRITTYLSFLEHARCPVRGFHNFLSYQRDWLDASGTGDCQGQAVRALAEVLGSDLPSGRVQVTQSPETAIFKVAKTLAEFGNVFFECFAADANARTSITSHRNLRLTICD